MASKSADMRTLEGYKVVPFNEFFGAKRKLPKESTVSSIKKKQAPNVIEKENAQLQKPAMAPKSPYVRSSTRQPMTSSKATVSQSISFAEGSAARVKIKSKTSQMSARRVVLKTPVRTPFTPRTPYDYQPSPAAWDATPVRLFTSPVPEPPASTRSTRTAPQTPATRLKPMQHTLVTFAQFVCEMQQRWTDTDDAVIAAEMIGMEEEALEREIRRDLELMQHNDVASAVPDHEEIQRQERREAVMNPILVALDGELPRIDSALTVNVPQPRARHGSSDQWEDELPTGAQLAAAMERLVSPPPQAPPLTEVWRARTDMLLAPLALVPTSSMLYEQTR